MTKFSVRGADLARIETATWYPSIPTYHTLNPANGKLTEPAIQFPDTVHVTEKIDGTNARIIQLPDHTYLIGSRNELLYAEGDLIGNPALGIVTVLKEVAANLPTWPDDRITVYYLEVYGGGIGGHWKKYAERKTSFGWRLFDVAEIASYEQVLSWTRDKISAWRQAGGLQFFTMQGIYNRAVEAGIEPVPGWGLVDGQTLPQGVAGMEEWLERFETSRAKVDQAAKGRAEGVVIRSLNRSVIAKVRFEDYARTLRIQPGKRKPEVG